MSTIIDSLIVKLGLADGDFGSKATSATKKMKDAEKASDDLTQSNKKLSASEKDTGKSFENVAASAAKFLAVIGGVAAVKAFIGNMITANSEIGRFSRNIGLSTETVSSWQQAAEQIGGSAQGISGTMDMLSKSQTELMLTGESSLIPYFSALGVALIGVGGKARPVDQILLDLSERFSHMDRTTANNMGRMMGIDQGTMNLLLQGRKALEAQIAEQRKSSAVTAAQAAEAERLQKSIEKAKQEWTAFGRQLLQDAEPALRAVLGWLKSADEWMKAHKEGVETFIKVFSGFLILVTIFKAVSGVVSGFITIIEAIGPAIELLSGPIGWIIAGITAVAAAIMYLKHDYDVWKSGGDSLIDWEKWKPAIDSATEMIHKLGEMISWTADKAKALWKTIGESKFGKFVASTASAGWSAVKRAVGIKGPALKPEEMQQYFQSQGWTKEQAAGIAANLMSESRGQKAAIGDNGKAYGLAQWHPDRQAEFKRVFGKDITDATAQEQMAFVQYELTRGNYKGVGDKLKQQVSAQDAGALLSKQYERPADREGEATKRGNLALAYANAPTAPLKQSDALSDGGTSNSVDKSVTTHIGEIKVYSAATDANGIAKDIGKSMDYLTVSQANSGLS